MLAVVTGAAVRVGRAIALSLASRGFDLALCAHAHMAEADALAQEIVSSGRQASVHRADLSIPTQVSALADELTRLYPAIDLLVNSAAMYARKPFAEITTGEYVAMQAVNLEAPFFLTQKLLPSLLAAPSPSIVNIVDIAVERAVPGYAHYTVGKAGLAGLTRALAVELAPRIRVNGVAPGLVAAPVGMTHENAAALAKGVPLQRAGSPNDVGRTVSFLALDAPYMSGQIIAVDGGWSAKL
jgi:pteridine reductase